jgi:hypothetical protein
LLEKVVATLSVFCQNPLPVDDLRSCEELRGSYLEALSTVEKLARTWQ